MYEELLPKDIVDLACLYTQPWNIEFHDPDTRYDPNGDDHDWSIRQSEALARKIAEDPAVVHRCIDRMVGQVLHGGWYFGNALATSLSEPIPVFERMLLKAESFDSAVDSRIFRGFVAGCEPESARECIELALKSPKLKAEGVELIASKPLGSHDIGQIVRLVSEGTIAAASCEALSFGRRLNDLPPSALIPLLDELNDQRPSGLRVAFNIICMYLLDKTERPVPLLAWARSRLLEGQLFPTEERWDCYGHRLEKLIGLLIEAQLITETDATQITLKILGLCSAGDHQRLFSFERTARHILNKLILLHPKAVWAAFEQAFASASTSTIFWMEHLVEPTQRFRQPGSTEEGGLLFRLPEGLYLNWACGDPSRRLPFLLSWIPILKKHEDGELGWHPIVNRLLTEFPGNEEVIMDRLSVRIHPTSWSGSVIPYVKPYLALLEQWFKYPSPAVRAWAREQHVGLKDYIARNQERDEEKDLGIW